MTSRPSASTGCFVAHDAVQTVAAAGDLTTAAAVQAVFRRAMDGLRVLPTTQCAQVEMQMCAIEAARVIRPLLAKQTALGALTSICLEARPPRAHPAAGAIRDQGAETGMQRETTQVRRAGNRTGPRKQHHQWKPQHRAGPRWPLGTKWTPNTPGRRSRHRQRASSGQDDVHEYQVAAPGLHGLNEHRLVHHGADDIVDGLG